MDKYSFFMTFMKENIRKVILKKPEFRTFKRLVKFIIFPTKRAGFNEQYQNQRGDITTSF